MRDTRIDAHGRGAWSVVLTAAMIVAGAAGASAQGADPSPGAVPSPGAGLTAQPLPVGAPVAPGRYWTTAAGPWVALTVSSPWDTTDVRPGGFALIRNEPPTGLTINPYAGVVFGDSCDHDSTVEADPTARGVIDSIAGAGGITPSGPPEAVTVGGWSGWQVDVRAASECGHLWLWAPPEVGDFHLDDGEAARFVALDTDEGVVVATLETFQADAWDQVLADGAPVIASIEVGPAPADAGAPSPSPAG